MKNAGANKGESALMFIQVRLKLIGSQYYKNYPYGML